MYTSIKKGLSSSHSFATSCRNLDQELINLSSENKKDFLACFESASFALGHDVPLSFAPMLIPSIDRAICSWTFYNGDIRFNPTQIFSRKDYQKLTSWKQLCKKIAQKKRLRQRNDGRFGSKKVAPKSRKTIKSNIKIGMFKKISEVKFNRESMITTQRRVSKVFEKDSNLTVIYLVVSLTCPFSLTRMKIPGRTKECDHITCFDLENFAKVAETQSDFTLPCPECKSKRKWRTSQLVVDPLFEDILDKTSQKTKKVRLNKDGKWEEIYEKEEEEEEEEEEDDEKEEYSGELILKALLDSTNNVMNISSQDLSREYIDLT